MEKTNQLDQLTTAILSAESIEFFHDQKETPYVRIPTEHGHEILPCSHSKFFSWCKKFFYDHYGKNFSSTIIRDVVELLKSKAIYEGKMWHLYNRIGMFQDNIVYSLGDKGSTIVLISKDDWVTTTLPIPLFKKEPHQKEQVVPLKGGDIQKIFDYINITDEDQKILFSIWLVSCFIPNIIHPLAYIYGPQGSAKSTISKVDRDLKDPSLLEVTQLPKNENELTQQLDHNYMIFYDNVSYISPEVSDLLCRAITGMGMSKRKLYTDNEDIIYSFRSAIGINGINLMGAQPDLLERSILFPIKRMEDTERKVEKDLWDSFTQEKPKILGAIFTLLSKAMLIKDSIVLDRMPRMADFAVWGCAIAEAMGMKKEDFLDAYYRNIESQTEEAINDSPIAVTLYEFMKDKHTWSGTPRQLFKVLSDSLYDIQEIKHIDFPKTEVALGKKLAQVEVPLSKVGIFISRERGEQRILTITNDRIKNESGKDTSKTEDSYENPSLIPF